MTGVTGPVERRWRRLAAAARRIDWPQVVRPARPLVAVALALVAMLSVTGFLLAHVVDTSTLGRWDLDVVRDLSQSRSSEMDAVTSVSTWLSNTLVVLAVLAVAVVLARQVTHRWLAPAFLVVAVAGEKVVYLVTSLLVDRDRPPVPTTGFVHATSSFPSGHVGAALALYGAIAVLVLRSARTSTAVRVSAVGVAVVVPPLVAFARLYRGVHYPTDVVAGAAAAAAWLTTAWVVVLQTGGRTRRPPSDGGCRRLTTIGRLVDHPE